MMSRIIKEETGVIIPAEVLIILDMQKTEFNNYYSSLIGVKKSITVYSTRL